MGKIYVLIDRMEGKVRSQSLEAVAFAQKLGGDLGQTVHALVPGGCSEATAAELQGLQLDSIECLETDLLAEYDPDSYCAALAQVLQDDEPELLVMGHIYQNIDFAPKLAARLRCPLATDCIGYRLKEGQPLFTRQMFRNKVNADVRLFGPRPWMVTIQSGAYSRDDLVAGSASLSKRSVEPGAVQTRRKLLERIEAGRGKVDLTKAEVIVAVGRGIKKQENMAIIEELAEVLGAEIGASRPVVDSEWLGRERQIGSSGQNVSPKLYFAIGISGAIQHVVGMKGASCIVAINSDRNSPIFNVANYGIVGDLFELVPALTKRLKEEKAD